MDQDTRVLSVFELSLLKNEIDRLECLKDKLRKIIPNLNEKEWVRKNDVRSNFFTGMKKILTSVQMGNLAIRDGFSRETYWDSATRDLSPKAPIKAINEFSVLIKNGWLIGMSILVEETLRLICIFIDKDACNNGKAEYESIYKFILKRLDLQRYEELFDLHRLSRNGIHTNYKFFPKNKKNNIILYKDKEYKFLYGEASYFINFDFIYMLSEDLICAMEKIVFHSDILSAPYIKRNFKF